VRVLVIVVVVFIGDVLINVCHIDNAGLRMGEVLRVRASRSGRTA